MDTKELPPQQEVNEIDDDGDAFDDVSGEVIKGFSKRDQKDMRRMGKQQELMRNFRKISSFSFTVVLVSTWEYLLMYELCSQFIGDCITLTIQCQLSRPRQWRTRWLVVGVGLDNLLLRRYHHLSCRNGLDGTNIWRPVSLGLV